jgi:GT2 family glycosyltransferase
VQAHCDRVGIAAVVETTDMPGVHRLVRSVRTEPLVSVIIPTRGTHGPAWGEPRAFVVECVRSLLERSTYRNVEVVCVYDAATPQDVVDTLAQLDPRRVRLVEYHGDFNFSRKVNIGAFHARGDRLLFLNDDTEVISEGWIEAMLRLIEEGDVGVVGARLLFPNRTVQHGGQFMPSGPGHTLVGSVADDPGPQYALLVERECEGVTAACSMMRRDVFELVGGFTERLANNFNDVDLCLKVRSHGMRIVWTPFAELWHFESVSRDNTVSEYELGFLHARWETAMARDRYFAPNLIVPPRTWDRPLFR